METGCDVMGGSMDCLGIGGLILKKSWVTLGFMYPLLAEADSRARIWSAPCRD